MDSKTLVTSLATKLQKRLLTKIKAVEGIAEAATRALEDNKQPRKRKKLMRIILYLSKGQIQSYALYVVH